MSESALRKITSEDILILCKARNIPEGKFLRRLNVFIIYLKDYISLCKSKDVYNEDAQLYDDNTLEIAATCLNYHYWNYVETYVRAHLKSKQENNKYAVINNYKIAATTEYIIMKFPPFLNPKLEVIPELNTGFAFYAMIRILFSWNEDLEMDSVEDLFKNNEPTKNFIEEHKSWLSLNSTWHDCVVFSNMQTIRLFYYWLKGTKVDNFNAH